MDSSGFVNQKQNLNFQKLTPSHIEDLGAYEEALNYAFSEKDVLNIALTGPYASGKTSIINSYIKKKKLNTMNISLAYFEPIEGDEGNKFNEEVKQKLKEERDQRARELMLERKIINQLIHQINADEIPNTEFRVKHKASKFQVTVWAFFITFLIMFFGYFSKGWFLEVIGINYWLPITLFAVVIVTVFFFSYQIIEVQSRKNIIQRLKIFDAELDISGSKKDESYFDKYLDEIIYILEQSKVKAIVFEDIDRYDDNLILSKLRELNCIYNRKQQKTDKQIKFIYLIKDEMFESKDRTKFFDFILPIIPIVDASNSLSKLNEFFEKGGVKSDFKDRTFLHDLSLYIDDIRLIKNIYNEYIIYRNKLHLVGDKKHDWLVPERLLAIITYKNLFPKDFSATRLGHGRGVLHRIISSFAQIEKAQKREKILEIDQEIAQLQRAIQDAEAEHLNSLLELQFLYIKLPWSELWLPGASENSSRIARSSLSNIEFLEKVIENSYQCYSHSYSDHSSYIINIESQVKSLDSNQDYKNREYFLENGKEHFITDKNNILKEKRQEKAKLALKQKIVDIIKESNQSIDTLFEKHLDLYKEEKTPAKKEYEVLKSSAYFPIIGYFLRNGIIDENYSDYMSFFYEGGIHVNDTSFLRNLADGIDSDWALELRTVDILLESRLEKEHFNSTHVLNFSLLDYLLTVRNNSLSTFITTLEQNKCIDFIDQYILRENAVLEICDNESEEKQKQ